jgi:hypothetical protein
MKESPNTLVKMKKEPGRPKKSEAIIKDVKRRTKRLFKRIRNTATGGNSHA